MRAHDVAVHLVKTWAFDADRSLTEADIRELNKVILVEPFFKEALTADGQETRKLIQIGEFKSTPNSVRLSSGALFEFALPNETPALMQVLTEWYRTIDKHPVLVAAEWHYRFICIHPFEDGNGRVARLLVNYHLMRNGFPPIVIKSKDKSKYLTALQKADSGMYEAFWEYIADQVIDTLILGIKAAKGESIIEAGDLDKRLSLLSKKLETIDESKDVKWILNPQNVIHISELWMEDLIREVLLRIRKFDTFFLLTNHQIVSDPSLVLVVAHQAIDIDILMDSYRSRISEANAKFNTMHSFEIKIHAQYQKFKKGGDDTFDFYQYFSVIFDQTHYNIKGSKQTANNSSVEEIYVRRLLHLPVSMKEIEALTDQFGESIYYNFESNMRRHGVSI